MHIQTKEDINRVNRLRQEKIFKKVMEQDVTIEQDELEHDIVLNMGPQHPATHGVLRLLLRLDGETVVKCVPEVGYLHRGMEKISENMVCMNLYHSQTDWIIFLLC